MNNIPDKDTINPEALRAARKRQQMTQQQLADALKCTKDTVSRWERGASRRVRSRLRKPLCDTLRTQWDTLTVAPDRRADSPPHGWTKIQVRKNVRASLQLAAKRYDVRPHDILELAPLLFVIAAERSLLDRRRRLEEIYTAWNEAVDKLCNNCGHLGGVIAARSVSADEQVDMEEKSLEKRDIFGRSIAYFDWEEGESEGPFVHFMRGLAKDLPEGAVSAIESWDGDMIDRYKIADDTLEDCTGLSRNKEQDSSIIEYILWGGIDLNECMRIRRDRSETDYRQWLSDELEQAEEAAGQELIEMFSFDTDTSGKEAQQ